MRGVAEVTPTSLTLEAEPTHPSLLEGHLKKCCLPFCHLRKKTNPSEIPNPKTNSRENPAEISASGRSSVRHLEKLILILLDFF